MTRRAHGQNALRRRRFGREVTGRVRHLRGDFEKLETRDLLAGLETGTEGFAVPACTTPLALDVAPQYEVHQTPRLQPGNAPLVGTPAYTGKDQVDILWQTKTVGTGEMDSFEVRFRPRLTNAAWQFARLNPSLDIGLETRVIHSASIVDLDWNTDYEYQVLHLRAGEVVATYQHPFRTRLPAGDAQPFRFVAYGDSASLHGDGDGFRRVQARINQVDPDFAVLLGDNFYPFGSHLDADSRFDPENNPAATDWIAEHIDYFGIGNHDGAVLNTQGGQPSRDSYSVPIPVAGVNAPVSPPANEYPEHNYSFDYGNVHFVAFDTNTVEIPGGAEGEARMAAILDYVVADLQASSAQWKIVFTHHPIIGTAKTYDGPDGWYFSQALPRLREAGVDLLLAGDSHTYSWTYPLVGFADNDQNGTISADEVEFVADGDRAYEKGAGLVQVVSGVGGLSLRSESYADPYIAAGYSTIAATGPIEEGFAQIDVTADRLTVTYISAESGEIVGDTNGNGIDDASERFFGRFQLVDRAVARGDLDQDGLLTVSDIDLICAALLNLDSDARFDLNADGVNDHDDFETMITSILGSPVGDVNLDTVFNSSDLVQVFQAGKYEAPAGTGAGWAEGDWNCDGQFLSSDLVLVFQLAAYRG